MSRVPIPDYGDLMTVGDFKENCQCGGFIPSDGDGNWATATDMDDDSNVWSDPQPDWATHVVWFNR